jgi:hypothetical protein
MAVTNPLYKRIAGDHPTRDQNGQQTRPKIPIEAFLALLRARVVGDIATDQALSDRIGEASGYQLPGGEYVPVGFDATELAQAQDLIGTVTGIATPGGTTALQVATRAEGKADRAMKLIQIRETLMCLEFPGLTGFAADDMAGTTGAAGGKLGVIRRDGP